jgi:uncharacterized membrane protein
MLRARPFPTLTDSPMRILIVPAMLLAGAAAAAQAKEPKAAAVDFEKQVWPILQSRCVECHTTAHTGPDGKTKKPKGGMTLDSKDGILASKNKRGKLLAPKQPADSLLYTAITLPADDEDRMPPEKAKDNSPLPKEHTELIKAWIEQGASFGAWTGKKDAPKTQDGEQAKPDTKGKPQDPPKQDPPKGGQPRG